MPAWVLSIPPIGFMLAVGACVGSFLNVVAFRLPRGEGLFRPGSRCPACETPLTWRENFPVLGWLWLGGRCRFCRSRVSAEYPLVEAACALMFAGLFAAWYLPSMTGVSAPGPAAPEWADAGILRSWPMFTLVLALLGGLIGMTLIDARTFTIPLSIPTFITALALLTHPLHAFAVGRSMGALEPFAAPGSVWTIPTPSREWLGAALGGGVGLALAIVALRLGLLPRSFADFEAWEKEALAEARDATAVDAEAPPSLWGVLVRVAAFTGPAIALMAVGLSVGLRFEEPMIGMVAGLALGLVVGTGLRAMVPERKQSTRVGTPATVESATPATTTTAAPPRAARRALWTAVLCGLGAGLGLPLGWGIAAVGAGLGLLVSVVVFGGPAATPGGPEEGSGAPHWLAYPHSRREMFKELLFCTPVLAMAGAGAWLTASGGPASGCLAQPPLWLAALGGSVGGILVGGGVVWGIRIMGTVALGKEAMGMGDVHLMACVGAALGWVDPSLAFLIAPAFGLGYALLGLAVSGRGATALPYGPHLALATVVVVVWKPWVEAALTMLVGAPVNLP